MVSTVLLAVGAPLLLGLGAFGLRRRSQAADPDRRGIALQTVIVMVVLLTLAVTVAAVLLTRGQDVIEDMDELDLGETTRRVCANASGTFTAVPPVAQGSETPDDPGTCVVPQ